MHKHSRFTPNVFSLVVMALALAGTGNAMAADATASSTGTVVTPITIAKAADLSFGSFAGGGTAGSVTVSTSGARTKDGGAVLMPGAGTAAQFDVAGAASANYSITLAPPATLSSGTNTMVFSAVSDLTGGGATSGNVTSGTLTSGGAQSIYVGGVLTVAANQPAGTYIGNITATVEYN